MRFLKHLPNMITVSRIIGTLCMLFLEPLKLWFFIVYIFTGITDVADGVIARRFHLTSEFGARLDSIADMLYYAVMLIMILPVMLIKLPTIIWYIVAGVLVIRIAAYAVVLFKYRRFASIHTYMNKLTGFSIFLFPFALTTSFAVPASFIVCAVGGIASLEELLIHVTRSSYPTSGKSIFTVK